MARAYAPTYVAGLAGGLRTHAQGQYVRPGDPLPAGTTHYDVTYFYQPTAADLAAGATPGQRLHVTVQNIPVLATDAFIRNVVIQARAVSRQQQIWTYGAFKVGGQVIP